MSKFFHIAVDGPVAAGKGTVCRLVAERLNFLYVDTGAMYRVVALLASRHHLPYDAEDKLVPIVQKAKIDLRVPTEVERDGRLITVFLNGEDVSWQIRTEEASAGSSAVSKLPQVRAILVEKQQEIAQGKNVVMEGRDITYRVLPEADLKIYLTGSDVVRSKRRHLQLLTKGQDVAFKTVFDELQARDLADSTRKVDPLKIIPEDWIIDTSDLSIEKVVEIIVTRAKAMMKDKTGAT